jgi:hypothetical protein
MNSDQGIENLARMTNDPHAKNVHNGECFMSRIHVSIAKVSLLSALVISSFIATGHAWAAEDEAPSMDEPATVAIGVISGLPASQAASSSAMSAGVASPSGTASSAGGGYDQRPPTVSTPYTGLPLVFGGIEPYPGGTPFGAVKETSGKSSLFSIMSGNTKNGYGYEHAEKPGPGPGPSKGGQLPKTRTEPQKPADK